MVFTWSIKLAGQDHLAAGVDPTQWQVLTGGRTLRRAWIASCAVNGCSPSIRRKPETA